MKRLNLWSILMLMALAFPLMIACGGDDSGDKGSGGGNNNGGGGGGTSTATFNIIGTWRAYYQSKDTSRGEVYDLVTFNSDYTGTVIEEVGYGSDNPESFTWKQTGNIIQVSFGGETITWTIQQIIDNNTVVVNDGKKDIKVYRDGTGGGGSGNNGGNNGGGSSGFVSSGGGSLSVAQLIGMWQVYHTDAYELVNGKPESYSWDVYPKNSYAVGEPPCYRFEFYTDYTFKWFEYNAGSWVNHGPISYQVVNGVINMSELDTDAEYNKVTGNKTFADEIVITSHYTNGDTYIEHLLKRVEDNSGGNTDSSDIGLDDYGSDTKLDK